jgi:uncharacterized membrane protein YfcA
MIDWHYSLAGAITGLVIGLTGVGGGSLMAPILLLVFDISVVTVVATDLWFAALTKIAAVGIYNTHNSIDWNIAKRLWLGSIPASILTILALSGEKVSKLPPSLLQQGIGILILLTSIGLILSEKIKRNEMNLLSSSFLGKISPNIPVMRLISTIIAGSILGIIITLTSVGAGVLGTLILVFLYSSYLKPLNIVATDIVHAIPLALLAGFGYLMCGKVDGSLLVSLLIGSVPTAILGASLAHKIRGQQLKIAIAAVMFFAGLKLLF